MRERGVVIETADARIEGDLSVPPQARGVVVFAHGSGSSRFSPRNRYVAQVLRGGGLATLLCDLLTPEEEIADRATARLRFDIPFLAARLRAAGDWLARVPETVHLPLGYFGASTGAAAALVAAARQPEAGSSGSISQPAHEAGSSGSISQPAHEAGSSGSISQAAHERVRAIVSRGGRPDLAGPALPQVRAPTLLIVGGADATVLELNRQALEQLGGYRALEIVPRATHLFEEPGALEQVAELALRWFSEHLAERPAATI